MVIARQFGKLRALHSHWGKSPWFRRALAVVAGAALALAFQKTNLAGLAWVAPALILWAAPVEQLGVFRCAARHILV